MVVGGQPMPQEVADDAQYGEYAAGRFNHPTHMAGNKLLTLNI